MSKIGISKFAEALNRLQLLKVELLELGTKQESIRTESGHQDILLGQLCSKMNDAVKGEFIEIISMKTEVES